MAMAALKETWKTDLQQRLHMLDELIGVVVVAI
jgi:hypothetical protein